ncbi:MAG: DoxX family protein [Fibrobacteria bacterium]
MRKILGYVLAAFFALAGANHFMHPALYLKMMPPYLPFPLALVYLSGILESVQGLGLLHPRWRRLAAWGLVGLLFLVFPANIHMALHPELFPDFRPWLLWARLPLQFVLIGLVLMTVARVRSRAQPGGV